MSNIHGLSFNRNEKKADQEEFFGGGHTSGTAVWRPTNGPQREGRTASPTPANNNNTEPNTADLRQIIQQARSAAASSSSSNQSADDRNIGLITIYSNGFILGNGEFRDIKDRRNAEFVDSLKKGEVPSELEAMCRNEWGAAADAVRVNLVDKSNEVYQPPKPKFSFATSKGQQLQTGSNNQTSTNSIQSNAIPAQLYTLDNSQPTTVLQIVLADRRKVKATFNAHTTIQQLYAHVKALANQQSSSSSVSFELVSGFPPKALSQPHQTLKEAGLMGASVTQQIQK